MRRKRIRQRLLAMKRSIAERIILLAESDPELLLAAEEDPVFADLLSSALGRLKPELRLWAEDVVWSEE